MGAWSDLEIDPQRVARIDPGAPSAAVAAEPTVPGAKAEVETLLTGLLGIHVARFPSVQAFFDALASNEYLAGSLQQLLAYAAIHKAYLTGRNSSRDRYAEDAEIYARKMKAAAAALAQIAPNALGLTGRTGRRAGGSIASTMSTYGPRPRYPNR